MKISVGSTRSELEEKLAKHIADEILRSNLAISRIHSNQSIRRIMEQELKKELKRKEIQGDEFDQIQELPDEEVF